jgi:hypothetical protein
LPTSSGMIVETHPAPSQHFSVRETDDGSLALQLVQSLAGVVCLIEFGIELQGFLQVFFCLRPLVLLQVRETEVVLVGGVVGRFLGRVLEEINRKP